MIGDPRPTTERKLLTHEEVLHNAECIKDQLAKFLSFDGDTLHEMPISSRYKYLNKDAFGNWIIKVQLSDPSELDNLMDVEAYKKHCE